MKMYKIINKGKSRLSIADSKGKTYFLAPGDEVIIDMKRVGYGLVSEEIEVIKNSKTNKTKSKGDD